LIVFTQQARVEESSQELAAVLLAEALNNAQDAFYQLGHGGISSDRFSQAGTGRASASRTPSTRKSKTPGGPQVRAAERLV